MNRIDRLFSILTFIQSKKYVPAEKIAEKFNISLRTVYRDMKALGESGIPISFEQYKGYFVMQGYFLPPVSFTSEEANAFLLMEAIVSGFGWHLIGWCHMRKEYRDFKVPRILKLTNTNLPFTINNHIALDQYMEKLPVDY